MPTTFSYYITCVLFNDLRINKFVRINFADLNNCP